MEERQCNWENYAVRGRLNSRKTEREKKITEFDETELGNVKGG